jgi:hypothetical protein
MVRCRAMGEGDRAAVKYEAFYATMAQVIPLLALTFVLELRGFD